MLKPNINKIMVDMNSFFRNVIKIWIDIETEKGRKIIGYLISEDTTQKLKNKVEPISVDMIIYQLGISSKDLLKKLELYTSPEKQSKENIIKQLNGYNIRIQDLLICRHMIINRFIESKHNITEQDLQAIQASLVELENAKNDLYQASTKKSREEIEKEVQPTKIVNFYNNKEHKIYHNEMTNIIKMLIKLDNCLINSNVNLIIDNNL
jgi:hypothetical protein